MSLPFAFASNSSIYGEEEKCIISEKRLFFSFSFKGLVRLALQDSFLQQSNCEMNFFSQFLPDFLLNLAGKKPEDVQNYS